MKEQIVDTLSNGEFTFKLPILYYESYEEADTAAGKPLAALRECNLNLDYRGARQDGRNLLVEVIQEFTSVEKKKRDTGKKDDEGNPVLEENENDGDYVIRALVNSPVTNEQVQDEVFRRARGYTAADGTVVPPLAVDIKQRERKAPKPRKLAEQYRNTADKILKGPNLQKFLDTMVSPLLPGTTFTQTGDTAKDTEALGWIIKNYTEAKNKADLAAMV